MNEFKYIVGATDEIQEGLNFWLTKARGNLNA